MSKPLRVLLVEDSGDDEILVSRTLARAGYDLVIKRVETPEAMIAALNNNDGGGWDIVLADFSLPGFNAIAALELLQRSGHDIPFIIVSGSVGEETAVATMKAGAHDYVMKENLARLIPAIERELREAEVRRERRAAEEDRVRLLASERRARQEAEAANRLKDEFLAAVSHELRTPLTAIIGWTHLLRSGKIKGQTVEHGLEIIDRNARSQARLVEDLLDISRIITGELRLEVSPVALVPVVSAALESLRAAANAKGILVRTVLDHEASPVLGDAKRLQQIIWNLLSNAIKFTPGGGTVEVRLERAESDAQITVTDMGAGISPEFLPFIFDRFRQADMTQTRAYGGLGLGLSIVRYLVELHGGKIEAASAGEGRGATFTVSFPLMNAQAQLSLAQNTSAAVAKEELINVPALSGLRVLIVDDEPDVCEMLTLILKSHGAEAESVTSGADALDELQKEKRDVLICDIGMPEMDGFSLIRRVRTLPPERGGTIPAAALTAYARDEDRARILASGFQIHMPKPVVDPVEFVTVVASLAERARVRQK
jgi:signal transduction histidine kinase